MRLIVSDLYRRLKERWNPPVEAGHFAEAGGIKEIV